MDASIHDTLLITFPIINTTLARVNHGINLPGNPAGCRGTMVVCHSESIPSPDLCPHPPPRPLCGAPQCQLSPAVHHCRSSWKKHSKSRQLINPVSSIQATSNKGKTLKKCFMVGFHPGHIRTPTPISYHPKHTFELLSKAATIDTQ